MLCPGVVEQRDDPRPFLPVLSHELENYPVLLRCPFPFFDLAVEMVLPALSALFGSLEVEASGLYVEIFGDLIPLSFVEVARIRKWLLVGLAKELVFFCFPGSPAFGFDDGE